MIHPCVMGNNGVKYPDLTKQVLWPGLIIAIFYCDLNLGVMTFGKDDDTPLAHGQQLC